MTVRTTLAFEAASSSGEVYEPADCCDCNRPLFFLGLLSWTRALGNNAADTQALKVRRVVGCVSCGTVGFVSANGTPRRISLLPHGEAALELFRGLLGSALPTKPRADRAFCTVLGDEVDR